LIDHLLIGYAVIIVHIYLPWEEETTRRINNFH